jgi:cyclase
MLKLRVIPTLLYRAPTLVKGKRFDSSRRVGFPLQAIRIYNTRNVDELVFLDIDATQSGEDPDYELIDDLADWCAMPLTIGGGIKKLAHIQNLLSVGADKVIINSAALENPDFITSAAEKFGSQCIVVSIDYRKEPDGRYVVYSESGTKRTPYDPVDYAKIIESKGAGEIILTSIDNEGMMSGYDLSIAKEVCNNASIQVILSGGAGSAKDMIAAIDAGASAVAAGSIFHFTEQTPMMMKKALAEQGYPVRN